MQPERASGQRFMISFIISSRNLWFFLRHPTVRIWRKHRPFSASFTCLRQKLLRYAVSSRPAIKPESLCLNNCFQDTGNSPPSAGPLHHKARSPRLTGTGKEVICLIPQGKLQKIFFAKRKKPLPGVSVAAVYGNGSTWLPLLPRAGYSDAVLRICPCTIVYIPDAPRKIPPAPLISQRRRRLKRQHGIDPASQSENLFCIIAGFTLYELQNQTESTPATTIWQ